MEDIFPDPESYRPERWLESSGAHLAEMESILSLNFGAGSRTCAGKHLAMIEIHKIIPELLRSFKIELADPTKEWKVVNYWFVVQEGVVCKLTRR